MPILFRYIKNQNVRWVARSLNLKPSVSKREMNELSFVIDCLMREASRMGQPFDHMLQMLCTGMQSYMLLFLMSFCPACARPCT